MLLFFLPGTARILGLRYRIEDLRYLPKIYSTQKSMFGAPGAGGDCVIGMERGGLTEVFVTEIPIRLPMIAGSYLHISENFQPGISIRKINAYLLWK